MQNVSPNFLAAVNQTGGREFKSRVVIKRTGYSDITYDDTRIASIKRTAASVGSQAFSIGDTVSSTFSVTLKNIDGALDGIEYRNAILIPSIGIMLLNGSTEYCPLGKYYVDNDNIERGDGSITLPAYDGMIKLTGLYISDLTYPTTLLQIAMEIASKAGLTLATTNFLNASLSISQKPDLSGTTLRQALSWVAEAACSFVQIDRNGDIALVWYSNSGVSIDTHRYFTLKHADSPIPAYDGVKLMAADNDLSGPTHGTSANPLKIIANPLLTWYDSDNTIHYNTDALNAIDSKINGFTFMPFECSWQGNPAIDPGDVVSLTDTKGATYSSYVMDGTLNYSGGLSATTQAYGLDASQTSNAGSLTAKVNKVTTEQQYFESLTATNFSAINSSVENLNVEKLNVTDAAVKYATVQQLNVTNENVNTLQGQSATFLDVLSDNGTFDDLTTDTATANYAALLHGTLGDAQIGSLSVAKLLAGVISTTKFTLQSDSGRLSLADNTMQVSDANRVRVQLGKDGNGDYNIYVWDASGNLMFDASGLHSSGIKSGIIRDSMVASDAAINATKIDKESMVSQINGATTLLNSSRVKYDSTGQTLTVAFDALKTTVTSQGSTLSTQGTEISTVQGQISSKIWATDITSAMSGLAGSGRNYALGTSNAQSFNCTGATNQTFHPFSCSRGFLGASSITVSCDVISTGSGGTVHVQFGGYPGWDFPATISPSTTMQHYVGHMQNIPSDTSPSTSIAIGIRADSHTGTLTISNFKLEVGTVATGWSPAPEDTATAISTNSSAITQLNNQIALKVDTSTYNSDVGSLQTRMSSAEEKITPAAITSTVKANLGGADIASIINQTASAVTINTSKFKVAAPSIDIDGLINSLNVTDLRAQRIHNSSDDSCYGTIGSISYFTWDSFISGSGGTVSKQGFQLNAKPTGYSLYEPYLNIIYADDTSYHITDAYINNGNAQALNIMALGGVLSSGCGIRLDSVTGNIDVNTSGDDYLGYGRIKLNGPVYATRISLSENGTGKNIKIGDDCYIGDTNLANGLSIIGQSTAGAGWIRFGDYSTAPTIGNGYRDGSLNILTAGVWVHDTGGSGWTAVNASAFNNQSSTNYKKDISKVTDSWLEKVMSADIVKYWYTDDDEAKDTPYYGLAIGEGYNVPSEIISRSGDGINQYSMTTMLWKAVQELSEEVNELKNK